MNVLDDVAATVQTLRAEVARLHTELVRYRLVIWTAGNVSARVPGRDLLVIKPSGVPYDDLTAESMVVTDLAGSLIDGDSCALLGHRRTRLRVPAPAMGGRRGAHPLHLRQRLGGAASAGAMRTHDGRRRVRR